MKGEGVGCVNTLFCCRDDLHQSLEIVVSLVTGSVAALPAWKGKQVEGW